MGDINKHNYKPVIGWLKKRFPAEFDKADETRRMDRAKAAAGDFGPPVPKEPGTIGGTLNRGKLLIGTTVFYEDKRFGEDDVRRVAEGGFDFLLCEDTGAFSETLAGHCEKHGVALIARNKDLPDYGEAAAAVKRGADFFAGIRQNPAHAGAMIADEPHAGLFEPLGEYCAMFTQRFPGQLPFINLFPAGTLPKLLGERNYKKYIHEYVRKVPSDFISVDVYPFFSFSLIKKIGLAACLRTYDTVGAACRETGRDFWLYMQTQGDWFDLLYTRPAFEQIRWQAYAALAFGARCLMHVSYTPVWGSQATAMIDLEGNVTEQYLYAKRINAELAALSPVYMPYKSLGVLPANSARENKDVKKAFGTLKKEASKRGFQAPSVFDRVNTEYPALVGYFEKEGGGYACMIVNCRNLYSSERQKTYVSLNEKRNIRVYRNGKLYEERLHAKGIPVIIDAGAGAFITVD